MKPLKLTVSAFGAFADTQTIDFAALGGSGLYLITGETGSGKTTIFDAISYALFGEASGQARDKYLMLRSDFAGEKTKTYVELTFASGDSRYAIRRTIKRAGGQEAELTLPDGTVMSGDRAIKPKIAEIIGLDRNQFAQIVMIAQNDFLRFLQSDTDERVKILRRIFGTGSLKVFQDALKAKARALGDDLEVCRRDFTRREADIYKRAEQFAAWEAQIMSDDAALRAA
ncbi:MAG: SMC family ATPase, partial [Oscillospiraceae bacterium]|nr:SMC family ATPase [Oscillospiraceae bacterium]